ncbi:MAG: hypothetical protein Athens071424_47 [Parcubacteria group bacterium Athens0714_24]|nr:MAG: hypothetical protein Athens071424_47 [Parcubacteria group bacterium Athens0714_24]
MNQLSNENKKYDLEERTARFGESIIALCRKINQDVITRPIISQLIRSSTSIGANYMEANGASSKKDFLNKIFICKKEAQETKHWLRMLLSCCADKKDEIQNLWKECQELTLIFQKIASSSRNKVLERV